MKKYNNDKRFEFFEIGRHDIEYELMQKNRSEFGEPKIDISPNSTRNFGTIITNKVIMDSQEDRKFLITGEYMMYEDNSAIDPVKTMDSNYHVWEIKHDKAHLMNRADASVALNINPDDIKGFKGMVVDRKKMNEAFLKVSDVISDKNLYSAMNINSHRLAQESGDFSIDAPDSRTKLKGHALLDEKLGEYKDQNIKAIKRAKAEFGELLDEHKLSGLDDSKLDGAQGEFDAIMDYHRGNLMMASLAESNFMVVDDQLMNGADAERFTEHNFGLVGRGKFMELGDIENSVLVGIADASTTDRIKAELGDTPLDDKLIRVITLKEKGSDDQTNLYVVEDIDRHLWVRADQTNLQGEVISRNEESLVAIGINADRITQGVSSERGMSSGEALEMRLQLSADHLRRLITDEQIANRKSVTTTPRPRPEPRTATTRIQRHIDNNFVVERLSTEQENDFYAWGSSNSIDDDELQVKSMWRVTDRRSGEIAIIADVVNSDSANIEHKDPKEVVLKYMNKSGEPIAGNNWINGFSMDNKDGVTENGIKTGLEELERFDVWEDAGARIKFEAMVKGPHGLKKSRYPYYGDEDHEDDDEVVVLGKRRKNAVKQ